jgi:hypothetical protein
MKLDGGIMRRWSMIQKHQKALVINLQAPMQ